MLICVNPVKIFLCVEGELIIYQEGLYNAQRGIAIKVGLIIRADLNERSLLSPWFVLIGGWQFMR